MLKNNPLCRSSLVVLLWLSVATALPAVAEVRLPRLLDDGAVLQRDKPLRIWGWADEGEEIQVEFAGQTRTTLAQAREGQPAAYWEVIFPAQKAGGPHSLHVKGTNSLTRKNLLVGDLWVAAGEANMALPMDRVKYRYPGVIESTRLPQLREFSLPDTYAFSGPMADYTQGQWQSAMPETLANFSAVGFFFGKLLHRVTQVPVGVIRIPVETAPVEAWVSEAGLSAYPHYQKALLPFKDEARVATTQAQEGNQKREWHNALAEADLGLKNAWQQETLTTDSWNSLQVPGSFKEQGSDFTYGSVWLRKDISLAAAQVVKSATLWLGTLVDEDQVFVNGQPIGQTHDRHAPRVYPVPPGLLKPGKNVIAIRLTSSSGDAGFVKDKRYALWFDESLPTAEAVSLQGEWKYQIAANTEAMPSATGLQQVPASLFNARIAPLLPFAIKGVIWYQGETNALQAEVSHPAPQPGAQCGDSSCAVVRAEYRYLLTDLIRDWRAQWNQGDFPFLLVQLANYGSPKPEPSDSAWAVVREAQREVLTEKATALAVAIDVGEWNDLHPSNKQSVGERLALGALKLAYGKKHLLASGPQLQKVAAKGHQLELTFTNTGTGLRVRGGGELKQVAIAGEDKHFVWASSQVKKNRILVWADAVPEPKWVRYAWADNPEGANLYNSAGLPASPFEARLPE